MREVRRFALVVAAMPLVYSEKRQPIEDYAAECVEIADAIMEAMKGMEAK